MTTAYFDSNFDTAEKMDTTSEKPEDIELLELKWKSDGHLNDLENTPKGIGH